MSAYSTNQTLFKDAALLVAALCEMGFEKSEIEVNQTAKHLYGYHGDKRSDTAEIIIRQQYVNNRLSGGSSNDIGFKLQANGTYGAIISAFDSHYATKEWQGKLSAAYARQAIQQKAVKQGLRFVGYGPRVNGKTQLQFVKA